LNGVGGNAGFYITMHVILALCEAGPVSKLRRRYLGVDEVLGNSVIWRPRTELVGLFDYAI